MNHYYVGMNIVQPCSYVNTVREKTNIGWNITLITLITFMLEINE